MEGFKGDELDDLLGEALAVLDGEEVLVDLVGEALLADFVIEALEAVQLLELPVPVALSINHVFHSDPVMTVALVYQ